MSVVRREAICPLSCQHFPIRARCLLLSLSQAVYLNLSLSATAYRTPLLPYRRSSPLLPLSPPIDVLRQTTEVSLSPCYLSWEWAATAARTVQHVHMCARRGRRPGSDA